MRPQLPPSVELELEVGAEEARAAGDADRIQQVLVNLLDNAVKYGEGSPVTVRVRPVDGVVCLSVQDSGPGLAPAEQARIFDKFYRARTEVARAGAAGPGQHRPPELVGRAGGGLDVGSATGAGAADGLVLRS